MGWRRTHRSKQAAPTPAPLTAPPTADERVVALVQAHALDVLAYLQRRTTTAEDAADVLSEVLIVAWRRIEDLPADDVGARKWLFTTARNTLANHHRGRRRADDLSARLRKELAAAHRTANAGMRDHVADTVRGAIEQLSPGQRELVTLVHWDGFTLAEAAGIVGVPASTARSRYAGARSELARLLGTGADDATDGTLDASGGDGPATAATAESEEGSQAAVSSPSSL